MGFNLFGFTLFDFSSQVTYMDAFFTIAIVCFISIGIFFLLKQLAPK